MDNFEDEYYIKKNRIYNEIDIEINQDDEQINLSDDEQINLSDDGENTFDDLDKMEQFEKDYPQEEYDNETEIYIRHLTLNKSISEQLFTVRENKKEDKNEKKNNKKSMSLNDLQLIMNKLEDDKKPKRFVSKRSQEKLQKSDSSNVKTILKIKRTFNPRTVPYFQSNQYKALQNTSLKLEDFPKL